MRFFGEGKMKCSVRGCCGVLFEDDLLFCQEHRKLWRSELNRFGMSGIIIIPLLLNNLLSDFQGGVPWDGVQYAYSLNEKVTVIFCF